MRFVQVSVTLTISTGGTARSASPVTNDRLPDVRLVVDGLLLARPQPVVERVERAVVPSLGRPLHEAVHGVHGVDLVVGRVLPGRPQSILGAFVADADRVAVVGEEVDGRGRADPDVLPRDAELRLGRIVEEEHDLESLPDRQLGRRRQSDHVEEQELLRQREVLLQEPVPAEGLHGVREQRVVLLETDRSYA
jgi:hypothetical protein